MPKYVFAYRIQEGDSGSPDAMAKWMAWFEELGSRRGRRRQPGVCWQHASGILRHRERLLGGYSMINADDLEAAVTLAKGCPPLRPAAASRSESSRRCSDAVDPAARRSAANLTGRHSNAVDLRSRLPGEEWARRSRRKRRSMACGSRPRGP